MHKVQPGILGGLQGELVAKSSPLLAGRVVCQGCQWDKKTHRNACLICSSPWHIGPRPGVGQKFHRKCRVTELITFLSSFSFGPKNKLVEPRVNSSRADREELLPGFDAEVYARGIGMLWSVPSEDIARGLPLHWAPVAGVPLREVPLQLLFE